MVVDYYVRVLKGGLERSRNDLRASTQMLIMGQPVPGYICLMKTSHDDKRCICQGMTLLVPLVYPDG